MPRTPIFLVISAIILLSFAGLSCDKGKEPTKPGPNNLPEFPLPTYGGDPAGYWTADTMLVALVDSALLDLMQVFGVDSFTYDTRFVGTLDIQANNTYNIACSLKVEAVVWTTIPPDTAVSTPYAGGDTLTTSGTVDRTIENALIFGFDDTFFRLDTLAYTATSTQLMLVSLPYTIEYLSYPIELYLVFYFTRTPSILALHRSPSRDILKTEL